MVMFVTVVVVITQCSGDSEGSGVICNGGGGVSSIMYGFGCWHLQRYFSIFIAYLTIKPPRKSASH